MPVCFQRFHNTVHFGEDLVIKLQMENVNARNFSCKDLLLKIALKNCILSLVLKTEKLVNGTQSPSSFVIIERKITKENSLLILRATNS